MNGEKYELTFFKKGIFGYGEKGEFRPWTLAHFMPILVTIAGIWLLGVFGGQIRHSPHEEQIRCALMFVMMLCEFTYFWRLAYVGPEDHSHKTMMMRLPLQICEWTLLLEIPMLVLKSQFLFNMVFYLTLTCNLVPFFVPVVISKSGPRYIRYYQFWGEHILPLWSMFYLFFVHGLRPHPIGILMQMIMLFIMLPIVLYFNQHYEDCDYFYLKLDRYPTISRITRDSMTKTVLLYIVIVLAACGIVQCVYQILRTVI